MALTRHRPPSPRPRRTAVAGKPRAAQPSAASAVDVIEPAVGPGLAAETGAVAPDSGIESKGRGAVASGSGIESKGRGAVAPGSGIESKDRGAVAPDSGIESKGRAASTPDSDAAPSSRPAATSDSDPEPPADDASPAASAEPATAAPGNRLRSRVTVGLSALTVVLLAAAGWFAWQAHQSTTSGPAANTAFSDSAATSAVTGQLSAAFEAVFSLDYQDVAKTQRAADQYLTGNAVTQYRQLLSAVQQQAVPNHLTLTSRVRTIGIKDITGTTAHVLVFADPTTSRAATPDTSSGGAQVRLTATEDNGQWRISDIAVL
ncbi:hypothetical protein AB0878_19390 [Amycolatopsis sp. NPDC047767]|uniref:hypothetical protein n=1 Tax=Amycolatopsis sp. NPDC047767 TaxID=3156765 RepID=UPI0034565380